MKDFLLKLYTIYRESNRKAADNKVILLLFSFIPVPNINIYYWALTGLKEVLTSYPNVVKVIDVIIDIYFQNIPIPIFILLCIIAALYFTNRIYKNRTEFISAKLYGCKINSKFFTAINYRAIATLGERYSPIIHVENEELDTLYKIVTEQIDKQDIVNLLNAAIREESKIDITIDEGIRTECLRKLQVLSEMDLDDIDSAWFDDLYLNIDKLSNQYNIKAREIRKEKTHHFDSTKLDNFRESISRLYDYRNNSWFEALVEPAIAVIGEAGIGKSHLLADIMSKRESYNLDSILLLGQWFSNQNTLKDQILSQLSLRCNFEEFLEVLNLYGEKRKRKTYILIDALNEGQISSCITLPAKATIV